MAVGVPGTGPEGVPAVDSEEVLAEQVISCPAASATVIAGGAKGERQLHVDCEKEAPKEAEAPYREVHGHTQGQDAANVEEEVAAGDDDEVAYRTHHKNYRNLQTLPKAGTSQLHDGRLMQRLHHTETPVTLPVCGGVPTEDRVKVSRGPQLLKKRGAIQGQHQDTWFVVALLLAQVNQVVVVAAAAPLHHYLLMYHL